MAGKGLLRAALACAVVLSTAVQAANLRWASQGDASTMDPHANNESFNNSQNNQVYEYLTQRDKSYKLVPWLAESWANVDPLKWVVKLRRGVKFHDGTPFTADDVVFSYDRARIANSTFKLYATQAGIPKKIDDYTVEFTTPVPNPLFHESIGTIFIMSRAWAEKHNAVKPQDFRGREETYSARNAMGTGPYRLVSYEPGVKSVYRKNTEWWGIREGHFDGNVENVEYRPISNAATRMAALRSGELDFVLDPPVQEIAQLRQDKALKVWEGNEVRVIFVMLDQGNPKLLFGEAGERNPFKDKRVRQALFQAIDVQAIRTQVMRGLSVPTGILLPDPAGAGLPKEMDGRAPHDPAAAKKLLSEAGYPNGFAFTLHCPNDRYINDEKICLALAAMWSKIGVRTKVEAMPRAQYFPKLAKMESSAYLYGWGGGSPEAIWLLKPILHTRNTSGAGDNNFARVSHPRLDALITSIESEMDTRKRHAMAADALKIVQEEFLAIPLHRQVIPWVSRNNVTVHHMPNNFFTLRWVSVR